MKQILTSLMLCAGLSLTAQTPQELKSYMPKVDGWNLVEEVEVFDETNLYNRINGAAPLYLENNFREMTSLECQSGEEYITIQAYRHATPVDAFGMYASERASDMTFFEGLAGEAQGDEYGLYFFAGSVYVKMSSSSDSEQAQTAMKAIAGGLASRLDAEKCYPALFASFPKEGQVPHTYSYITHNYIGHEFLHSVYTVDYQLDGRKFQAFLIDGQSPEGAKAILENYFAFTKQSTETLSEGRILVKDRYNGDIPILWKGQYLVGVFDENGEEFPAAIYELLEGFRV